MTAAWKASVPLPSETERIKQEEAALEAVEERIDAITARYPLADWQCDADGEYDEGGWRDLSRWIITLSAEALRACGVRLPVGWDAAEIVVGRGGFVQEVKRA